MVQKYDMVCINKFGFLDYKFKVGDKCRILDFKRYDSWNGGMMVAVEFERNVEGHNASAFPEAKGKWSHCVYFDRDDMKNFKFIEE